MRYADIFISQLSMTMEYILSFLSPVFFWALTMKLLLWHIIITSQIVNNSAMNNRYAFCDTIEISRVVPTYQVNCEAILQQCLILFHSTKHLLRMNVSSYRFHFRMRGEVVRSRESKIK